MLQNHFFSLLLIDLSLFVDNNESSAMFLSQLFSLSVKMLSHGYLWVWRNHCRANFPHDCISKQDVWGYQPPQGYGNYFRSGDVCFPPEMSVASPERVTGFPRLFAEYFPLAEHNATKDWKSDKRAHHFSVQGQLSYLSCVWQLVALATQTGSERKQENNFKDHNKQNNFTSKSIQGSTGAFDHVT